MNAYRFSDLAVGIKEGFPKRTIPKVTSVMEFLLSDGSDGITGHNIVITGGR